MDGFFLLEFGSSRRESVISMTAPCTVERLNIVKDMRLCQIVIASRLRAVTRSSTS